MLVGRSEIVETILRHAASTARPLHPTVIVGARGVGRSTVLQAVAERLDRPLVTAGFDRFTGVRLVPLSWALASDLGDASENEALAAIRAVNPSIVVCDDIDEADAATVQVLTRLARDVPIVASARTADHRFGRATDALVVDVPPLGHEDALALAEAVGASDPAAVAAESGGRPGAIVALAAGRPLPTAIVAEAQATLAGLAPPARNDLALLALAAGPIDPQALADLTTLERRHLVTPGATGVVSRYGALARLALDQFDGDSKELHRRAAAAVTEPMAQVRHLTAAEAPDEEVVVVARRLARSSTDPLEAATLFAAAAERSGALTDHLETGRAAVRATAADLAASAAEQVMQHPDGAVEGALLAAQAKRLRGDHGAALRTLPDDTGLEDDDLAARIVAERARLLVFTNWVEPSAPPGAGDPPRLLEAIWEARRSGDGAPLEAAASTGHSRHDRDIELTAIAGASLAAAAAANGPAATAQAVRLVTRAVETGAPAWATAAPGLAAAVRFHLDGRADALLAMVAGDAADTAGPLLRANAAVALAAVGRTGEALALAGTAGGEAPVMTTIQRWAATEIAASAGRLTTARAAASRCIEDAPAGFILSALAALAIAREEPGWAAALDRSSAPEGPSRLAEAIALERAALALDDASARPQAFTDAAAAWQPLHRLSALRCAWAASEAAILVGSEAARAAAVTELRRVEAEAAALGLRPLVARARRTLRAAGVHVAAETAGGSGRLSPREHEVLALVRQGRTSAEIAAHIGVARSTIETQVKSAMQKLGATSRLQAAAMAAESNGDAAP